MFIKVIGCRYINLEKIEFLFIDPVSPSMVWLTAIMNGEEYKLQSYSSIQNAEYAINFVMRLIENLANDKRIALELPTEQHVEFYRRVDKDMEDKNG